MYFAEGYAVIPGREGEGTEELGIPTSMKFPDHAGTIPQQSKIFGFFKKKKSFAEIKHSVLGSAAPGRKQNRFPKLSDCGISSRSVSYMRNEALYKELPLPWG